MDSHKSPGVYQAVVREKRQSDMRVECFDAPDHLKTMWVSIPWSARPTGKILVGDGGICVYTQTASGALWMFVPEQHG